MRKRPPAMYLTAAELEERIREREADTATEYRGSDERQTILKEVARLKSATPSDGLNRQV